MADKKISRFDAWLSKMLYALMVSYHHEDYICEGADGETKRIPANVWHKKALQDCKQR